MEGWVTVRYSVLADGSTANVRAIDVVPPQLSASEALAAVEQWRFVPASLGGGAIDWYNNESVVLFGELDVAAQAGPDFSRSFAEIDQLIAAEEYEEAIDKNARMLNTVTRLLVEVVVAQVQAALAQTRQGDLKSAYAAIVRATHPDIEMLGAAELNSALKIRYALEMQLGYVIDAFDTYARMEAIEAIPEEDLRAEQARAVRAALDADAPIATDGRIDRDPWRYALKRRIFTFADIEGSIRSIEVECDRRTTTLEFEALVEWNMPASWGDCVIAVVGRRGTEFALMQFN
jgi:hypothetical protein